MCGIMVPPKAWQHGCVAYLPVSLYCPAGFPASSAAVATPAHEMGVREPPLLLNKPVTFPSQLSVQAPPGTPSSAQSEWPPKKLVCKDAVARGGKADW